jgi:hypothetical protein
MAIDDLDDFLDLDDALPVVAGAVTGLGYLDLNSEIIVNNNISIIDYLLTTRTDKFGNLVFGTVISVNGESYRVEMPPQPFDDGSFCRIPLMKTLQQIITAVFATDVFESGVFVA